ERRAPFTDGKMKFIYFNKDLDLYKYLEFDQKRRVISNVYRTKDWFDQTKEGINYKWIDRYEYDENDWNVKYKMKIKRRPPIIAYDSYYQLVKLNHVLE